MQTRRDLKRAYVANLFGKLEIAAFERRPELTLDSASDICRRDRAVQTALLAGFGFDHDRLRFESLFERLCALLLFRGLACRDGPHLGDLLEGGIRGSDGQPAWNQKVTRIPVGDFFDLP